MILSTHNNEGKYNGFAKAVRIITIPPILVSILVASVYMFAEGVFKNAYEAFLTAFFLGIFPVLAYPFQKIIPSLKSKGRVLQRKLAFVFTIIGYFAGMIWVNICDVSENTKLIIFSYFFASLLLASLNVFTSIKASGHSCSATGVLIYTLYFFGAAAILLDIVIAVLIVWSSLKLKRHTALELFWGAVPSITAFIVGYIIM